MSKKKILVVDDEVGFTSLLTMALSRYEVLAENDALRALDVALQFQPDLILLDVLMPGMDGGDLATKMRAEPALERTPIVFLTAVISPAETGGGAKQIGAYPFLAKPVDMQTLIACIEEHSQGS